MTFRRLRRAQALSLLLLLSPPSNSAQETTGTATTTYDFIVTSTPSSLITTPTIVSSPVVSPPSSNPVLSPSSPTPTSTSIHVPTPTPGADTSIPCGCPGSTQQCFYGGQGELDDSVYSHNDAQYVGPYCGPPISPNSVPRNKSIFNPDPEHPEAPDLELTDDELDAYKSLELEFLASILQNPFQGEKPLDLPYCGLTPESVGSGTKTREKRGLTWKKVFKGAKKMVTPPKRPTPPVICPRSPPRLSIPVQFNVITTNQTNNFLISNQVVTDAIANLNDAYKGMGVTFSQKGTIFRKWKTAASASSLADIHKFARVNYSDKALIKRVMTDQTFRRGVSSQEVNIFLVEEIVTGLKNETTTGFCYYPGGDIDGCVVTFDSLKGVSLLDSDTDADRTMVHEVGHWFGLKHTFDDPKQADCTGNNRIATIPQYPYSKRFQTLQDRCPVGKTPLPPVLQVNWMSYSPKAGETCIVGTDVGCMDGWDKPFVQEQAASAYTQFYAIRGGSGKKYNNCFGPHEDVLKFQKRGLAPPHPKTPSLYRRLLEHRARQPTKRDLLEQRPHVVEELMAICSTPWAPGEDPIINAVIPDRDSGLAPPYPTGNFSVSGPTVTLSDGDIGVGVPVTLTVTKSDGGVQVQTTTIGIATHRETSSSYVTPTGSWQNEVEDGAKKTVSWIKAHGSLVGGLVAAVVLAILAGLALCCCRKKRNRGRNEWRPNQGPMYSRYTGGPAYSRANAGEEGFPLNPYQSAPPQFPQQTNYYDQWGGSRM
ncbi:hypothetical protein T439DRAFT_327999 [Meredithblackwellia eburnea MCA 4105]